MNLLREIATLETPVREGFEPALIRDDGGVGGFFLLVVRSAPIKELYNFRFCEFGDLLLGEVWESVALDELKNGFGSLGRRSFLRVVLFEIFVDLLEVLTRDRFASLHLDA